jgi:hypothetical protein
MATLNRDQICAQRIGVSFDALVLRIVRTFDRANVSDLEAGARWYNEARDLAENLAYSSGYSREHCAAVISHMSPRTTWARNVTGAVTLLTYGNKASGIIAANYDRALASLEYLDPLDSFGPTAPKTRNFAANIAGDDEAVTVDVWALRVVGLDDKIVGRAGVYDVIADAYRAAARRRGVLPTTMQATTWIVARNGRSE